MATLNRQDILEILKMFEDQFGLLFRIDRLEKMEIRKKTKDAVMPLAGMDIKHASIFMDILEEKLHDVFPLFVDGYEFRKKIERKVTEILKDKEH